MPKYIYIYFPLHKVKIIIMVLVWQHLFLHGYRLLHNVTEMGTGIILFPLIQMQQNTGFFIGSECVCLSYT